MGVAHGRFVVVAIPSCRRRTTDALELVVDPPEVQTKDPRSRAGRDRGTKRGRRSSPCPGSKRRRACHGSPPCPPKNEGPKSPVAVVEQVEASIGEADHARSARAGEASPSWNLRLPRQPFLATYRPQSVGGRPTRPFRGGTGGVGHPSQHEHDARSMRRKSPTSTGASISETRQRSGEDGRDIRREIGSPRRCGTAYTTSYPLATVQQLRNDLGEPGRRRPSRPCRRQRVEPAVIAIYGRNS